MALQTGDRVQFTYVDTGTLPANPDDATLYILGRLKRLYLGSNLIASDKIMCDTTAGWAQQSTLQSQLGYIYVYTDHQSSGGTNIPGIKIGDGNAYVIDLPFIDTIYAQHIADTVIHVSQSDRDSWDNKVTCFIDPSDNTKLVFSKD